MHISPLWERVWSHPNQALMCWRLGRGNLVVRLPSLPSRTTLWPLCYFSIIPFLSSSFLHAVTGASAHLYCMVTPSFVSISPSVCFFFFPFSLIWRVAPFKFAPPLWLCSSARRMHGDRWCQMCQRHASRPSVAAASSFLAVCQSVDESTGRTGLIYRRFRLFGRHFTSSTVTSAAPPVTLIGSTNIKPGKSCQVPRTPPTWYLAPMARWSREDVVSKWDWTDRTVWAESPILYPNSDCYLPMRTPAEQPHAIIIQKPWWFSPVFASLAAQSLAISVKGVTRFKKRVKMSRGWTCSQFLNNDKSEFCLKRKLAGDTCERRMVLKWSVKIPLQPFCYFLSSCNQITEALVWLYLSTRG